MFDTYKLNGIDVYQEHLYQSDVTVLDRATGYTRRIPVKSTLKDFEKIIQEVAEHYKKGYILPENLKFENKTFEEIIKILKNENRTN
jgi:hypothetical protein